MQPIYHDKIITLAIFCYIACRKKERKKKRQPISGQKNLVGPPKRVVFFYSYVFFHSCLDQKIETDTNTNRKRQPIWLCKWQRVREKIYLKKKWIWIKQNMIVVYIEIKEKAVCRESKWFSCWKVSLLFILDLGACVRVCVCSCKGNNGLSYFRYCLNKALNFKWNMICSFELAQQVIFWFNEYGLACGSLNRVNFYCFNRFSLSFCFNAGPKFFIEYFRR